MADRTDETLSRHPVELKVRSGWLVAAAALAILAGCGGGTSPQPITNIRPEPAPPPPPPPPATPTNLRVADRGADFIVWRWDAVSGAAGYQAQVSVGDDNFDPPDLEALLGAEETAVRLRDEALASASAVYLRVRAFAGTEAAPRYGAFTAPVPGSTSASGTPPAAAPAEDRAALEALYRATDGEDWRDSDGWLDDADLGDWYGVTTDTDGRVTRLELTGNRLDGRLPAELGDLARLEVLRLDDNRLSGPIPPALGQLASLETLELHDNPSLSGTLPTALASLGELSRLDLRNTALCAPPDAALQRWLAGIGASAGVRNCVHGGDRAALAALHDATGGRNWTNNSGWLSDAPLNEWYGVRTDADGRVSRLELDTNGLSGALPRELGDLSALSVLELHNNPELSGALPGTLTSLDALRSLDLRQTKLCAPGSLGSWLAGVGVATGVRHCDDWAALEALHKATGGGNWTDDSGWLSTEAFDDWHGVATDGDGRVSTLTLDGNGLTGELPPELGGLSALTALDLHDNGELGGPLPASLSSLDALARLDLGDTKLCAPGSLESWIEGIRTVAGFRHCDDWEALEALYMSTRGVNWTNNTRWLSVAPFGDWYGITTDGDGRVSTLILSDLRNGVGNGLSGEIPPELGQLANLTELVLLYNRLSGEIPPELGQLSNLTSLDLAANQLSGEIPPELGQLAKLTSLRLFSNQLNGAIPPEIGGLGNLEILGLSGAGLSGSIPAELGRLKNLRELFLQGNRLSGTIPSELGQLSNLAKLLLSHNFDLTGELPSELGQLTRLTVLDLRFNRLSGAIPDSFLSLRLLSFGAPATLCAPLGTPFTTWLAGITTLHPNPFPRCSQ